MQFAIICNLGVRACVACIRIAHEHDAVSIAIIPQCTMGSGASVRRPQTKRIYLCFNGKQITVSMRPKLASVALL